MKLRAVLFDAYGTLFDVHSVALLAEQLFPGQGERLSQLWRDKQIEYTRLITMSSPDGAHYRPFWELTRAGLRWAAARLGLPLDTADENRLMNQYRHLSAFPESREVLAGLQQRGLPTGDVYKRQTRACASSRGFFLRLRAICIAAVMARSPWAACLGDSNADTGAGAPDAAATSASAVCNAPSRACFASIMRRFYFSALVGKTTARATGTARYAPALPATSRDRRWRSHSPCLGVVP